MKNISKKKQPVKETFARHLADQIIRGELKPGDRLPPERELAKENGISKTAVHLALTDLERMGFVKTNARHGTYVCDFSRTGNIETLDLLVRSDGSFLDEKRTSDMLEMRMALEGTAIDRLCRVWAEDAAQHLRQDLKDSESIVHEHGGASLLAKSFFRYHHDICAESGNFILPLMFNTFEYVTTIYWEQAIGVLGEAKCLDMEQSFYDLLSKKDAAGAKQYLSEEFRIYRENVRGITP